MLAGGGGGGGLADVFDEPVLGGEQVEEVLHLALGLLCLGSGRRCEGECEREGLLLCDSLLQLLHERGVLLEEELVVNVESLHAQARWQRHERRRRVEQARSGRDVGRSLSLVVIDDNREFLSLGAAATAGTGTWPWGLALLARPAELDLVKPPLARVVKPPFALGQALASHPRIERGIGFVGHQRVPVLLLETHQLLCVTVYTVS